MDVPQALLPISEKDVRATYEISNEWGVDNSRTSLSFQLSDESDGTKVMYFVQLHADSAEPLLDQELQRWLCDKKTLLGQAGRSRVAIRIKFYLRRKFQNLGLATYIVKREEDLFRRWGAKEVQLLAMDFGRWIWTREKFDYTIPPLEFALLQQKYREWQRANGVVFVKRAVRVSDFPKEFLLSGANSITLFKVL